jgi:hypothetical protein
MFYGIIYTVIEIVFSSILFFLVLKVSFLSNCFVYCLFHVSTRMCGVYSITVI